MQGNGERVSVRLKHLSRARSGGRAPRPTTLNLGNYDPGEGPPGEATADVLDRESACASDFAGQTKSFSGGVLPTMLPVNIKAEGICENG